MRSRRDDGDAGRGVERALTFGLVGVGGVLPAVPADLDAAIAHVASRHDERMARRLERFATAPEGALVWTRDAEGLFWLGGVAGPWRYDPTSDAAAVDLVHVRPCRWRDAPVPPAQVPPPVRYAFARGGRNWQEIRDASAAAASAGIWAET